MYADMVEQSSGALAREYRCWGLSQVRTGWLGRLGVVGCCCVGGSRRQDKLAMASTTAALQKHDPNFPPLPPALQIRYMLGDAGRSLLVGFGRNPPKRTQDRGAACPDAPEVG